MSDAQPLGDPTPIRLPQAGDQIYPSKEARSPNDRIPAFGEDTWSLRFYDANPTSQHHRIHWKTIPANHREHIRLATWAALNVAIPIDVFGGRRVNMVSKLGASRVYATAMNWRMLAIWMEQNQITEMRHLNEDHFAAYAAHLTEDRRVKRPTMTNHLMALTRLWIFGTLISDLRLAGAPPWLTEDEEEFLPDATRRPGENLTEPISTSTMAPLLDASIRFVRDVAGPILRAHESYSSVMSSANKGQYQGLAGREALNAYLAGLKATGAPIPTRDWGGRVILDSLYLAHLYGLPRRQVRAWSEDPDVREYVATNGSPVVVPLIADSLVPEQVPLQRVPELLSHLRSACFVVISYLTGMRPGEVLALQAGALEASSTAGGWMLIRSRTFKSVRDEDGNHDSNGRLRDAPWVAVAPVVRAIRVLEEIADHEGLLFPSGKIYANAGRARNVTTIGKDVNAYITFVNSREPGRIPDDPFGRVAPMRFRRTLAWHIANQPSGLVALAVQYGHLRTAISEGYASRSRDGIHDLIDYETARAVALRLSDLSDSMENGEGVSGPAAQRLVAAVREQRDRFGGIVATKQQARALLGNPSLTVYDNQAGFLLCNFKRDTALCLNRQSEGGGDTPRFERCQVNCTNIARTDSQVVNIRLSATRLREEATVMPQPAARRLMARADELEVIARGHDEKRITVEHVDD